MVVVEIRSPVVDDESGGVRWIVCAMVHADGDRLEYSDPNGVLDPEMPVLDVVTRRQVVGSNEPEAWARNLPHAFRAGDMVAAVLTDTDPPEALAKLDEPTAPPRVPEPPAFNRDEALCEAGRS